MLFPSQETLDPNSAFGNVGSSIDFSSSQLYISALLVATLVAGFFIYRLVPPPIINNAFSKANELKFK